MRGGKASTPVGQFQGVHHRACTMRGGKASTPVGQFQGVHHEGREGFHPCWPVSGCAS